MGRPTVERRSSSERGPGTGSSKLYDPSRTSASARAEIKEFTWGLEGNSLSVCVTYLFKADFVSHSRWETTALNLPLQRSFPQDVRGAAGTPGAGSQEFGPAAEDSVPLGDLVRGGNKREYGRTEVSVRAAGAVGHLYSAPFREGFGATQLAIEGFSFVASYEKDDRMNKVPAVRWNYYFPFQLVD